MTSENSGRKIAARSTVLIPIAVWHFIALALWYKGEVQRCQNRLCYENPTLLSIYGKAEALIEYHILSIGLIVVIIPTVAIVYWIITGKNLFKYGATPDTQESEEDPEEPDNFVPCTNPCCPCASHSNERFVSEWRPND